MVICVTLNPAVDVYLEVRNFQIGKFHRVEEEKYEPGGKGFITAEILLKLGYEKVLSTGLLAGRTGLMWEDAALKKGVPGSYVYIMEGSTRRNIQIFDLQTETTTSISTKGPYVDWKYVDKLIRRLRPHLNAAELILFGGSLPMGMPIDSYKRLTEMFKGMGKKVAVNATNEYLVPAAEAVPFMLVEDPKADEEHFGDIEIHSLEDEIELAAELMRRGIEIVSLSWQTVHNVIGIDGEIYHVEDPLKDDIKSVIGANSALTAGLIHGYLSGMRGADLARHAVATAHATAVHLEPDIDGILQVKRVYDAIRVERVR